MANFRNEKDQEIAIRNFIENLSDVEVNTDDEQYSSDEGLFLYILSLKAFFRRFVATLCLK